MDQHLNYALSRLLGHKAPFTAKELAGLTSLEVLSAGDLKGLERCTGLQTLTLFGVGADEIGSLRKLKKLHTLKLGCMPVTDLSPLAKLTQLADLTVNFTHATDATALLAIRSLQRAELIGDPWDDESYERLAKSKRPAITLSPRAHWTLTRQLFDRGAQLAYGHRPGAKPALVVCNAGVAYQGDYAETAQKKVEAALKAQKGPLDTDEFLDAFPLTVPKDPPLKHLVG